MRLIFILILVFISYHSLQAQKWYEPWTSEVIKESDTFGLFQVLKSDSIQLVLRKIEIIEGLNTDSEIIITNFYNESAAKIPINKSRVVEGSVYYLLLKKVNNSFQLATPYASIDEASVHGVRASFRSRKGYLLINFNHHVEDEYRTIHSYVATEYRYVEEGKPYDWYLNLVIAGAIENGFPEEYINQLKATESEIDMNMERRTKNEEILKRAKG